MAVALLGVATQKHRPGVANQIFWEKLEIQPCSLTRFNYCQLNCDLLTLCRPNKTGQVSRLDLALQHLERFNELIDQHHSAEIWNYVWHLWFYFLSDWNDRWNDLKSLSPETQGTTAERERYSSKHNYIYNMVWCYRGLWGPREELPTPVLCRQERTLRESVQSWQRNE